MKNVVEIDARGLSCPQPVLIAKKTIENSIADIFVVSVDNPISRENVCRFLNNQGFDLELRELASDHFEIEATRNLAAMKHQSTQEDIEPGPEPITGARLVVYLGTCRMGSGDEELGQKLMRGFLRTLIDMHFQPWRMIFINSGVKLTTEDAEAVEALTLLSEKGVEILSCGTCLQHYGVDDRLAVGRSTTMYEVLETLNNASKVISPD